MESKIDLLKNNPYVNSWKESLASRINDKEKEMEIILMEINDHRLIVNEKKNKLTENVKLINITLSKIKFEIEKFLENINLKLKDIKNLSFEDNDNDIDNINLKSEKIFTLLRDVYQDAKDFFSKKEFNTEPSDLIPSVENNNISSTSDFLNYLGLPNFKIKEDTSWSEWLAPVWFLEEYYKSTMNDCKTSVLIYENELNKLVNLEEKLETMKSDILLLQKESDALSIVSEKLKSISI